MTQLRDDRDDREERGKGERGKGERDRWERERGGGGGGECSTTASPTQKGSVKVSVDS